MTVASIGSKFGGRKGIRRKRKTAVQPRMNFNESLIYREYDYSMDVFRLSKVEPCIKARPPKRGRALTKPTICRDPTFPGRAGLQTEPYLHLIDHGLQPLHDTREGVDLYLGCRCSLHVHRRRRDSLRRLGRFRMLHLILHMGRLHCPG